jgi:hypothetical protein
VQSNPDGDDQELLALAQETDRVADIISDLDVKTRLREIASEVRLMARGRASVRATSSGEVG